MSVQAEPIGGAAQTSSPALPKWDVPRWDLYRLLSDPTRLRLLALTSKQELAVGELAQLLRLGQPKASRHAAALRDAGLLHARKQGTWVLLRLVPHAELDPVVKDALTAGLEICQREGSLNQIADVLATRDAATREFFARGGRRGRSGPPAELAAYLRAMAPLLPHRELAIDVGTGDGALLEVLAPLYRRVIAVDRSEAQLELARERGQQRLFRNVDYVCGELSGPEVQQALANADASLGKGASNNGGADAVFAARILHHAPIPAESLKAMVTLARPPRGERLGGQVIVLDYEGHDDQSLQEQQADLWLGFEPDDLLAMAKAAGLEAIEHGQLPSLWQGDGPDRHLAWQWLSGRRA